MPHAARVGSGRIWLPAGRDVRSNIDRHRGPAAASGPVTLRRVGGEHRATLVDSCTLSDGEGQGEHAQSRRYAPRMTFVAGKWLGTDQVVLVVVSHADGRPVAKVDCLCLARP